jgi:hypothetical protein
MLANDEITVRLNGEVIHLRPTLRAAFRLERRYGGLDRLVTGIAEGNTSVIRDLINATADNPSAFASALDASAFTGLARLIIAVQPALIDLAYGLAGIDPDATPDPTTDNKADPERPDYARHLETLFGIATGWLGWAPETAWNATPGEITAAYRGRLDMLRAIFGPDDAEKAKAKDAPADLDTKLARVMARLAAGNG